MIIKDYYDENGQLLEIQKDYYDENGKPLKIQEEWLNQEWFIEQFAGRDYIGNGNRVQRRHNISLDAYNLDDALIPSKVNIENDYIRKDEIDRAMKPLSRKEKDFINMKYIEGYKAKEIADIKRISKAAVSQQDSRTLKKMRNALLANAG